MKENNHRWSSLHVIIFSIFYYIFGQKHITPVLLRFPYINPMHYKAYVFRLYLFYTICAKKYEIAACIINVGVIRKSYQSYNASEPYSKNKGGISYIPWCITSYNIINLLNSCDPVSSTGCDSWTTGESDDLLYLCCADLVAIFILLFQIYLLLSRRACFGTLRPEVSLLHGF